MKGKIAKIWMNNLDDGRTYATLSINGERYTLWDKKYLNSLKEGDTVSYDFKQSGKYKNIKSISKVNANPKDESNSKAKLPYNGLNNNGIDQQLKKDLEIVRMSCLKTAALYITQDMIDLPLDKKADTIVEVAKKFESYVTDFEDFLPIQEDDGRKLKNKAPSHKSRGIS